MVNHTVNIIKEYTFKISLYLFLIVSVLFVISIIIYYIEQFFKKIKSLKEKKYFDFLYSYFFGKCDLNEVTKKKLKKSILTDIFSRVIPLVTGDKQLRLKKAVKDLALIEVITKNLHSIFPSKRIRACYLLGVLGLREHAKLLVPTLHDPHPRVVSSAIIALGELKEESTVPEILSIFPFCTEAHAWLISAILPFFGPGIYKYIKPYMKIGSLPDNRLVLLIKVVSNLQISESVKDLVPIFLQASNLNVKINALIAIGKINDLSSVKIVLNALEDKNWQVRAVAANIIGDMALKGAIYRLIPLLNDKNWFVRKNSATAIAKMGKLGIYTLIQHMDQKDKYARDMIVQTLEELGIVDRAIKDLKSNNPKTREDAKYILKILAENGYTKYLENFIEHEEEIRHLLDERMRAEA